MAGTVATGAAPLSDPATAFLEAPNAFIANAPVAAAAQFAVLQAQVAALPTAAQFAALQAQVAALPTAAQFAALQAQVATLQAQVAAQPT
jgi:hypothetical protein